MLEYLQNYKKRKDYIERFFSLRNKQSRTPPNTHTKYEVKPKPHLSRGFEERYFMLLSNLLFSWNEISMHSTSIVTKNKNSYI
jgi:hypothetical protein